MQRIVDFENFVRDKLEAHTSFLEILLSRSDHAVRPNVVDQTVLNAHNLVVAMRREAPTEGQSSPQVDAAPTQHDKCEHVELQNVMRRVADLEILIQ